MFRKLSLLVSLFVMTACSTPDVQSTPEGVVNKVFEVSTSKKYDDLKDLCAPEADQGIQKICDLKDAASEEQERFSEVVSKGRVGQSQINGDKATIRLMDEKGKADGTVFLAKKKGRWYMVSSE
jgi:hypothetical protein